MQITDFFDKEYTDYAQYDSFRSLSSFMDGQKPTARKIICTVDRNNIREEIKLSSLVNKMSEEMEYLHGPAAAEGVAVGLAQDFVGTNNINLLKPVGAFGYRTIQRPSASRYIKTCKLPIFDKVFIPLDKYVLIEQEFEGTNIEPRFYVPIIPLLLVNGNEGIGNGFAQKILARDPLSVIDFITKTLDGKKTPKTLLPAYKGFKGEISRIEGSSFEIKGRFDRTNSTTITVDELPVGYDLEKYVGILAKLEEDKVIQDFTDKSCKNSFLFEIKVPREFVKKDDEWILNKLKLVRRVTENFTCIGVNNEIVEYKDEVSIINDFILHRLEYYEKRKAYQVAKIKKELLTLGAKYYFVKAILDGSVVLFKRSKLDICKQIVAIKGFPFADIPNLDFLINMPLHSVSDDTFKELKDAIDKKKQELKEVSEKPIEETWKEELADLKKLIDK